MTWLTTAPTLTHHRYTLEGEQACIYGCNLDQKHDAHCPCQTTCPDHEGHCNGCAPRPTVGASLLCGSCFYRRLRRPLRRVTPLYDWLGSRKAPLKAAAYDGDRVTATKESPLPFNVDIFELLGTFDILLNGWATRVAREAPPAAGPPAGAPAAAVWLDDRASWISEQAWVSTFIGQMVELNARAGKVAPWQATRHRLPLPCLRCEQQTLVLFGGEDWVTCTADDCDNVIGWSRYERLSRAIAGVHEDQVG